MGCLSLHHLVVLLNGNRGRARVLAHIIPRRRQRPPGAGQGERVVVSQHPLHFQQLLLPELVEQSFEDGKGELQGRVEGRQRARAMQPQVPQNQIGNHATWNTQVLQAVRNHRPGILPGGRRGCVSRGLYHVGSSSPRPKTGMCLGLYNRLDRRTSTPLVNFTTEFQKFDAVSGEGVQRSAVPVWLTADG